MPWPVSNWSRAPKGSLTMGEAVILCYSSKRFNGLGSVAIACCTTLQESSTRRVSGPDRFLLLRSQTYASILTGSDGFVSRICAPGVGVTFISDLVHPRGCSIIPMCGWHNVCRYGQLRILRNNLEGWFCVRAGWTNVSAMNVAQLWVTVVGDRETPKGWP